MSDLALPLYRFRELDPEVRNKVVYQGLYCKENLQVGYSHENAAAKAIRELGFQDVIVPQDYIRHSLTTGSPLLFSASISLSVLFAEEDWDQSLTSAELDKLTYAVRPDQSHEMHRTGGCPDLRWINFGQSFYSDSFRGDRKKRVKAFLETYENRIDDLLRQRIREASWIGMVNAVGSWNPTAMYNSKMKDEGTYYFADGTVPSADLLRKLNHNIRETAKKKATG